MPKRFLLLVSFLITSFGLKSQSTWLKGFVGVRSGPEFYLRQNLNPEDIYIDYQASSSLLLMPAVAYENRKGNFWEIGVAWQGHKDDDEYSIVQVPPDDSVQMVDLGETKYHNLETYFDFNYRLFKQTEGRWKTYLGWSINPYWSKFTFTPMQPYLFERENYVAGADFGVIPRANYDLTSKLRLDLNICFFVFSANYEHTFWGNPSFSEQQQNSSLFDIGMFEKFWMRIGLSWKITDNNSNESH